MNAERANETAPAQAGAVSAGPAKVFAGSVFAAVDIGASSGRVILGRVQAGGTGGENSAELEVVHRFPNGVVEIDAGLRWDFDALFAEVSKAGAYSTLSRRDFDDTLRFVEDGGYALRSYDRFRRLFRDSEGLMHVRGPQVARQLQHNRPHHILDR